MDRFFATASRGTEQVLAEELRALGIRQIEQRHAGVVFGASLADAYRALLWSTVASRVLLPIADFTVDGAEALYEGVHAIDWALHLGAERTLAVDVAGGQSPAGPPQFVVLKAKDAIVDCVRSTEGARPDIDTAKPDVRVNLHLSGTRVTVSIDLSGRSLHRRGIDRSGAQAPLKENLAAALLRVAGWPDASVPLFDPFCGSGTILIEAAWMALDVACGLSRERIGAEGWRGHDRTLWKQLREEAEQRRAAGDSVEIRIAGSDASQETIGTARQNLQRAGLAERVSLATRNLRDVTAPWDDAGILVTNPPYGARIGEVAESSQLFAGIGPQGCFKQEILQHIQALVNGISVRQGRG
jgi:23S rRNA (guanine2445-N2)-methyltransferase / 23S rRNA (guanine2069-N7)-methyltransferase